MGKQKLVWLVALIAVLLVAGCSNNTGNSPSTSPGTEGEEPRLEYSVFFSDARELEEKMINNPNDVVTPYIEELKNVKVTEYFTRNTQTFQERLNQWVATRNVPDVIIVNNTEAEYAISTGQFAELTPYLDGMTNFKRYFNELYWPKFETEGQRYQLPVTTVNWTDPTFSEDPYALGPAGQPLWIREDILKMAGYSFTPLEEIAKQTTDQGIKPTLEDFAIEPAIDTPEQFYELLKKIKDLNLEVGGRPLVPLSLPVWGQFHFGNMFDFGHWYLADDGSVNGYAGSPESKEWHIYLNKLFQEGLLDNDFMIHKDDQLQEKAATGRLAVGMWLPDLTSARQTMQQLNPDAKLRYMPWPKKTEGKGFHEIQQGAFHRILINKDYQDIERLIEFLDWTLSDEALEVMTWGPESAGLWEMKDGVKVFKDKDLENAILTRTTIDKGPEYYGIFDERRGFTSKIGVASMAGIFSRSFNPFTYMKSYPLNQDIFAVNRSVVSTGGLNFDGRSSFGSGEIASKASKFHFDMWSRQLTAKVLEAKTPEQFDQAWDEIYAQFEREGGYQEAKAEMERWFAENYKE